MSTLEMLEVPDEALLPKGDKPANWVITDLGISAETPEHLLEDLLVGALLPELRKAAKARVKQIMSWKAFTPGDPLAPEVAARAFERLLVATVEIRE